MSLVPAGPVPVVWCPHVPQSPFLTVPCPRCPCLSPCPRVPLAAAPTSSVLPPCPTVSPHCPPCPQAGLERCQREAEEVAELMRQNVAKALEREGHLEQLQSRAQDLRQAVGHRDSPGHGGWHCGDTRWDTGDTGTAGRGSRALWGHADLGTQSPGDTAEV